MVMIMLALPPLYAAEQGSMPYKNINRMLTIIDQYAQSPYTGLIASVKPEKANIKFADISLSIEHLGKEIRQITVKPNGSVEFPLIPEQQGEEATLIINQPKGSVSLAFTAGIKPLTETTVEYHELFGVLKDLETVASELIGIPSWLIPSIDELEFSFASNASLAILTTGKGQQEKVTQNLKTNSDNKIVLKLDEALFNATPLVQFSSLPTKITIVK